MTDDTQPVGDNAELEDIAKMPIDIKLLDLRISSMGRHGAIGSLVGIIRFIKTLTFLSSDNPERILSLISEYPEFRPMCEEVYELCRNTEEVMRMFSEELAILDKNTVQYMIDEMQAELNKKDNELAERNEEIKRLRAELELERRKS